MKTHMIYRALIFFSTIIFSNKLVAADRYRIHKPFYENFFSTAAVQLTAGLGNLTYNSNSITEQKMFISTLPVSGASFTVHLVNKEAILHWTTLEEFNTTHFEGEHSTDGISFTSIRRVSAAGNSTSVSGYSYTHHQPVTGAINYYRIKQTDIKDRCSWSSVRSVKSGK